MEYGTVCRSVTVFGGTAGQGYRMQDIWLYVLCICVILCWCVCV